MAQWKPEAQAKDMPWFTFACAAGFNTTLCCRFAEGGGMKKSGLALDVLPVPSLHSDRLT